MTTTTAAVAAAAINPTTTTTPSRPSRSSTVSSTTSSSDFQVLSSNGGYSDSEDEIVWSLASSIAQVSDLGDVGAGNSGARGGGSESSYTNSDSEAYHSLASDDDDDDFVVLTRRTGVRGRGVLGGIDTPIRSSSTRQGPIDNVIVTTDSTTAAPLATTPTTATFLQARLEALTLANTHVDGSTGASSPNDSATKLPAEIIEKHEKNEEAIAREDRKQAQDAAQSLPTPDVTPKRERKGPVSFSVASAPIPSGSTQAGLANPLPTSEAQAPAAPPAVPTKKKKKGKKSKAAKKRLRALAKENSISSGMTAQSGEAPKKAKKSKKKATKTAASAVAPAAKTDETAGPVDPSLFKEASDYISSFLTSPEARSNPICRLTLLQSLIVELGLVSSALNLPASLKSAKTFLKTRAFLNIREYISVRGQGQEAIRKLLYPSRSALIKDIRKKRNAASLQWVKEHGLQVFLVGCFH